LEAAFDVAGHGLDGLEWDHHSAWLEGGNRIADGADGD
jgi:hypothetical protein